MTEREFLKDKTRIVKVDFRKIYTIFWNMKYIFLVSIILCLTGAYFYLRYTTPVYKKNITVVLNNQKNQYSNNYQLMSNTLGIDGNTNFDNQIFILKSARLMGRVVQQGNFNIRYFDIGHFVDTEKYTDSPIQFSFDPKEGFEGAGINMEITFSGAEGIFIDSLLINNQPVSLATKKIDLGQKINTPMGSFNLTAKGNTYSSVPDKGKMRITRASIEYTAKELAKTIEIISSIQQPDALIISLRGKNPQKLEDILNMLVDEYNILTKENDSESILNTISFLDERIQGLETELKEVEGSFTEYRATNELLDLSSQSKIVMSSDQGYKERLNQLSLQLSLLGSIKESFLGNTGLIPVNIGLTDGTLNSSISQYNQLVIDRNKLLAGSSENNPKVQSINELLITLKDNIKQSIDNLEAGYNLQMRSLTRQQNQNQRELVSMPSKQLALTRMSRLQQVKEPLYILLQQKREEALLMLSSLSNQAYVVDKASGSDLPIFPRTKQIYLLAFIIAILVPAGIVLIMNVFREKIICEKDIVERTDIPLLGVVPSASKNSKSPMKANIITDTGNDPLTESFRMLRSKLECLSIDRKKEGGLILQISSSGPWEGKSFVSINMALSLAFLGKKVLLVGADLHRPALSKYMGIDNSEMGLSAYLTNTVDNINKVIVSHADTPNLDIIPAGPLPLNPSELLSLPLLEQTLDDLRKEYDYIIIDSAPFLVVSSGFIISKYVDCTIYVVRSGYTKFSIIDTLNNIMREGSLSSVMIMLNAVNFKKNSIYGIGGFGESYSYGYGYINYNKMKK